MWFAPSGGRDRRSAETGKVGLCGARAYASLSKQQQSLMKARAERSK
jgi:hypothetical protein